MKTTTIITTIIAIALLAAIAGGMCLLLNSIALTIVACALILGLIVGTLTAAWRNTNEDAKSVENSIDDIIAVLTKGATPEEKECIIVFFRNLYNNNRIHDDYFIDPGRSSRKSPKGFTYWSFRHLVLGVICSLGVANKDLRGLCVPKNLINEVKNDLYYDFDAAFGIKNLRVKPAVLAQYIEQCGNIHIVNK